MIFFTENPAVFAEGEFYTVQSMASLPPLPGAKTLIGQGYNLVASPNITRLITGSVSFQYLGSAALVEGVDEDQLTIHFWDGTAWHGLDTVRDTYYNLASAPSQGSGVYALLAGVATPAITAVSPSAATNDVTTTLAIGGDYFLPPVAVALVGPTGTYTLPILSLSPFSLTAVVTRGLPANEYQVLVYNLNEPGSPAPSPIPGTFALYDPADACFYDFFESGPGKWQPGGDWAIVTLPSGGRALTDSPTGNYDSASPPAVTHTTYITSQAFSLASCPNPLLTFRHDYVIVQVGTSQDVGRMEVSTDGGATWTELSSYSSSSSSSTRAPAIESSEWADVEWKDVAIGLQAALGNTYTGTLRLRFGLEVDQTYSDKGWLIDDVIVRSGAVLTADLQIAKARAGSGDDTATPPEVVTAGDLIAYTITVTNAGPATVDGVVTDTFPTAGATLVSCSGGCSGAGPVVWHLTEFTGTQSLSLALTTVISSSGTLTNTAIVTPTTPYAADPAPGNNEDSVSVEVVGGAERRIFLPTILRDE